MCFSTSTRGINEGGTSCLSSPTVKCRRGWNSVLEYVDSRCRIMWNFVIEYISEDSEVLTIVEIQQDHLEAPVRTVNYLATSSTSAIGNSIRRFM